MKNLSIIALAFLLVFSSCKKEIETIDKPVPDADDLASIIVPEGFDWSTTKQIDVQIVLPENTGLMRTKIFSEDGTKLYYKGYPSDTTQRVLLTNITVPVTANSFVLTNGITETYIDLNGDVLSCDFNQINKRSNASDDFCGECDGQITELELEYVGNETNPTVKVTQKKDDDHNYVIYEGNPQGAFYFIGANNHNKMGATIKVYVNDMLNIEMHTSCSVTFLAGMIFGDFEIISGVSDNGGDLCYVEGSGEDDSFAGTVIYEDLYPYKGDYDFNDLVIDYNYEINKDDNNFVNTVVATFTVKAFGASFHNAFGFQFPAISPSDITSVTGYVLKENSIFNMETNGVEMDQSIATFIVYDDAFDIMQHPGSGIGENTTPGAPYVEPVIIELMITFNPSTVSYEDLNIGSFNPFIVMKQDRGFEVHLANYEPTDLFDVSLFATGNDDSNAASGRYFVTDRNLPWAINIPANFNHMIEKYEISTGYLKFIEWAESAGNSYPDWHENNAGYIDDTRIYQIP